MRYIWHISAPLIWWKNKRWKGRKLQTCKGKKKYSAIFYTGHSLCQKFVLKSNGFRFFGMVMIICLWISLYRQFQCSGSRFLNQVTFFEEDEEEIVVVDVIVPHSDAAEILHVKWWDSTVYTCGKEGKWKMKRVGS